MLFIFLDKLFSSKNLPSPYLGMSLPDEYNFDTPIQERVSVPIPGDVPSGLVIKNIDNGGVSFRPHTWGCPFRTFRNSSPGTGTFPSPYLGMSLPDLRRRVPQRRSFVSVPIPGDVPNGREALRQFLENVSVPIPGDVPNGLYTLYHTEKYINCKQKIRNPPPCGQDFHRFWGRF